jgi:hypothetical protein
MLEAAFAEGGVHLVVDYSENMRVLVNPRVVQAK